VASFKHQLFYPLGISAYHPLDKKPTESQNLLGKKDKQKNP
jgi:hypothetical protein